MSSNPWMKFYTSDWRSDPRLKMCSAGARGVWIEMICLMHEATPYGHLLVHGQTPNEAQLASLTGIPSAELDQYLAELERMGVFSRTKEGVIYSRKLVRMASKSAKARKSGKQGGNPTLRKQRENDQSDNRPIKANDKPQRPEARSQNNSIDQDFDEWWLKVPRKVGKGNARAAYKSARKKTDAETLLAGIERYARSVAGKEERFIAHPATWLNGERWLDECATPAADTEQLSDDEFLQRVERSRQLLGRLPPMTVQDEMRYRRLKQEAA